MALAQPTGVPEAIAQLTVELVSIVSIELLLIASLKLRDVACAPNKVYARDDRATDSAEDAGAVQDEGTILDVPLYKALRDVRTIKALSEM